MAHLDAALALAPDGEQWRAHVHSTSGQQARLWSRDGVLLATTEQLCWYR